jgi:fatty acid desaturase
MTADRSATATVEERYDPLTGMPKFEEPNWAKVPVERKTIRALQRRSDIPGLIRFGTYIGLLVVFGALTIWAHQIWLQAVFFLLYATVYGFSEPILHETHHRTPFRTLWLNETAHFVAGLFAFKEPLRDRWLHAGHHTYTYYSELDPEILTDRPPRFWTIVFDFMRVHNALLWLWSTVRTAVVGVDELGRRWIPTAQRRRVIWSARACVAFYVSVVALGVAMQSWYPVLFIFVARFIGAPLHSWITFTQHAGLEENVADWRQNTRTVRMNPLFRLFSWNMNYHIEHHMHPTVPFHSLDRLHAEIESESPPPYPSTVAAWSELIRALWRQRDDPSYSVHRPVPGETATRVESATRASSRGASSQLSYGR